MHRRQAVVKWIIVLGYFLFAIPRVTRGNGEVLKWIEPAGCTNKNEYFQTDSFECKRCPNNLVSSDDGYSCICDKNSRIVTIKEGNPICDSCGTGKIQTTDGYECISCRKHDWGSCGCSGNEITIERSWNGTVLETQKCLPCPKNTYPSVDHSQCLPCVAFSFKDGRDNWSLDDPSHESLRKYCMPSNAPRDWSDVQNTYTVKFKRTSVDSYYFRRELRFTYYSCEFALTYPKTGVRRACSQLANMCSLTLFTTSSVPCNFFARKTDPNNPSKLFYREGEARTVLNRRTIAQRYTLDQGDSANNRLKLIVARFGLRGRLEAVNEPSLPCPYFSNLPFGVNLLKRCKISASELTNARMMFLVPYLSHFGSSSTDKRILQPLPVLIRNINEYQVDQNDPTRWQLVERFFTVDRVTGYRAISNSKNSSFTREPELQVLRYIKSLSLVIKLQERSERGKIFPPLIVVEYDELNGREIIENVEVSVEYRVTYSLSDEETSGVIEVCIGVFTGFAVAFAALKASSYSRRSCKSFANIATIGWFIVHCLGAIGNVLLVICSCFCLYTFVFYKGQKFVHVLLPNRANERTIRVCTIVAFAFKTVEILGLMYQQRRTNVFFIDWEKPKIKFDEPASNFDSHGVSLGGLSQRAGKFYSSNERNRALSASEVIGARRKVKTSSPSRSASRASTTSSRESTSNEIPIDDRQPNVISSERNFTTDERDDIVENEINYSVSIWRTCVVANEWLRLKTTRKINVLLQILVTLFILEIVGGKYWSKAIPKLTLEPETMLSIDESFTLEYAVGIFVYLTVYTVQWWFSVFIHQRYVKNQLQEFVDLCSMANISVFILSHDFYGYYIHGRSVHGFADTDLLTLIKDLQREEKNLCAHRGLIPGTTEQTFVISVSKTFRTFYDRLVGSQNSSNVKFLRRNVANVNADWDERWKTHLRLKKFFTDFLDHCYKNVDYTVKERHFLEKMCDLEMTEVEEKSIFYIDNAYSFDRTIFYGNEWTLATFEINLFLLVLVLGDNYILASIVTLLVSRAVNAIAKFNGKQLLAGKTFIDERFLISQ